MTSPLRDGRLKRDRMVECTNVRAFCAGHFLGEGLPPGFLRPEVVSRGAIRREVF